MGDGSMRDERGHFVKGVSGNPGGRTKGGIAMLKLKRAMRELRPTAMKKLAAMLESDDPDLYVKAVELWLKYNCALPKQDVEHTMKKAVTELNPELAARLASLELQ